jgi:hypothetical protein
MIPPDYLPFAFRSERVCHGEGSEGYPRGVRLQAVHRVPTLVGLPVTHFMSVGCAINPRPVPARAALLP